jgi:hypothetical protein
MGQDAMTVADVVTPGVLGLKVGELVEVRTPEEILSTLDDKGELDGLPFMPEMLAWCGRRLTVHKVAHKSCDYIGYTGMRRMRDAVHLTDSRCDGSAHGGCENRCSLYWKEQWLKRVDPGDPASQVAGSSPADPGHRALLPLLVANAQKEPFEDGATRWACQATEMQRAAPEQLPLKDLRQYRDDITSGNATVLDVLRSLAVAVFNRLQDLSGRFLPPSLRFRGGLHWGFLQGGVTSGRTPTDHLDLQPGDLVRIKSREEIMATLDRNLLNRGLGFEAEMSRFCGRTARVKARATRCLDERSGRMLTMKNPCIILEDVVCEGAYSANCPREYMCWWREIWLERLDPGTSDAGR